MAWFKPAHLFRSLRPQESLLAREVFHKQLPPLNTVGVTDGLGDGDQIWTVDRAFFDFLQSEPPATLSHLKYLLNFGDAVRWDLSTTQSLSIAVRGYPYRARDVFVHEMTHVWQFHHGVSVKTGSIIARAGAGYEYTSGGAWITYNVEQQASIVEHWNRDRKGTGEDHEFFPYIHYIIRQEGDYKPSYKNFGAIKVNELWLMDLTQLTVMLQTERTPVTKDEPVRVWQKDDSFLVVLDGDVLFDFDKAALKPAAIPVLQRAATTIKSKTTPRLRSVLFNGHTDSAGNAGYNMGLSERRARTIADWFVNQHVLDRSLVRIQGFGETQPAAPNTTPANRAKNRRVEIYLVNS